MKKATNLTWPARLAILNKFKPSDTTACKALQISADELKTARELEQVGTLVADSTLDVTPYASLFSADGIQSTKPKATLETVVRASGKGQPALSATKASSIPKKRGRKGTNIAEAFAAIPATATPVEAFAETHKVSVAVLRQGKRFDTLGTGQVRVKKDKATGSLMIWRDAD